MRIIFLSSFLLVSLVTTAIAKGPDACGDFAKGKLSRKLDRVSWGFKKAVKPKPKVRKASAKKKVNFNLNINLAGSGSSAPVQRYGPPPKKKSTAQVQTKKYPGKQSARNKRTKGRVWRSKM